MFPWIEHHHTVCCSAHISLLSTRRSVFVTRSILMWHLIKVSPFDALPPSVCIVLQTCSCSLSPLSLPLPHFLALFSPPSLSSLSLLSLYCLTPSLSPSLALILALSRSCSSSLPLLSLSLSVLSYNFSLPVLTYTLPLPPF